MKKLIVKLSVIVITVLVVISCTVVVVSCTVVDPKTGQHVVDPKLQTGLEVATPIVAAAPAPWGWIGGTVVSSIGAIALGVAQFKNRKK